MLSPIFERFVKETPISVIARSAMERIFNPEQLDQWFDTTAQEQYTKDLLFTSVFDIMSQGVLETVMPNDAWVADRNFCTLEFTSSIASKGGFFVIREHKKYPWKPLGKEKYIGDIETGKVYEQLIYIVDKHAREHTFRRIRVRLISETRDGDSEIAIISNIPGKFTCIDPIHIGESIDIYN